MCDLLTLLQLLTDQCAAQMQLRQSISNSALSLLQEQIHDQKQLLAMQHKAQMDLWQQHRGANLAELQKKHSEQIARFEKMHVRDGSPVNTCASSISSVPVSVRIPEAGTGGVAARTQAADRGRREPAQGLLSLSSVFFRSVCVRALAR